MKLLILGGTVFLGRFLTEVAQARSHDVTLFNRGQHNADLFPDVEKLRGDRLGDLSALAGRQWDAVVDTSGYIPRAVRASAEALAGSVEHYTFISSISVYANAGTPGINEDAPVGQLADPTVEEIDGGTYGPLKALCEQAVEEVLPGRALNIRPGLIVGPHDPTDRFTYWVHRIAQGGEVLAPGRPDRQIQVIDVRDLAEWTIRAAEARTTGTFNATGPAYVLTMREYLNTCAQVSGSDAQFTWVDEQFLLDKAVGPWMELPLWIPENDPDSSAMLAMSIERALAAGLTFRPLAETVRATLAWDQSRPSGVERRAGLAAEREQGVLREWHSTQT